MSTTFTKNKNQEGFLCNSCRDGMCEDCVNIADEFMKDLTEDERQFLRLMRYALKAEREKTHSFWRAVFDALWSGVTQAHALLQKLFKE